MRSGDKIAKKLGDRYEVLSGFEVYRMISKIFKDGGEPLNKEQDRVLFSGLGDGGMYGNLDMPFLAYAWKAEKVETKWYWRITTPILFIYMIIYAYILMPIKWVFTGTLYLPENSRWLRFNMYWINKVFDRK